MGASINFLLFMVVTVSVHISICQQQYAVLLNSSNGTEIISCWTGGLQIPCQNLESLLKNNKNRSSNFDVSTERKHNGMAREKFSTYTRDGVECATWMHYSNETNQCVCGVNHHGLVKCNATLNETYILVCHQMTYDEDNQQVIAGLSFYGCLDQAETNDIFFLVPANRSQINKIMCSGFNRDGRLCGVCMDGHSPLVYSYQLYCKKCSDEESKYNWVKFIAMAFIPLTGFYFFIVLFKFNANSPRLHSFVLFTQIITCSFNIRMVNSRWNFGKLVNSARNILETTYGIWNLDFFRTIYPDICLRLTTLQALSLDYIIAFYLLLLIAMTYFVIKLHSMEYRMMLWIWKLVRWCLLKIKCTDNINRSMIDVFATFLLLSYNKILSVSFDLLIFTVPIDSSGNAVGRFLYYDASYEYFGRDHLPYGVMAILSIFIFILLPFLLLLFYPMKWFQKCLNHFRLSYLALHTFVDSFAGCYKDGTEPGTRDCRYFAALFLLVRILVYSIYQLTPTEYCYGWCGLLFSLFVILCIAAQPYKPLHKKYNIITASTFVIMIMLIIAIMNTNLSFLVIHQATTLSVYVIVILAALPLIYAIVISIEWVWKQWIIRRITFCKHRFRTLQTSQTETSMLLATER